MAFENVGKVWTPVSLAEYLEGRAVPSWITEAQRTDVFGAIADIESNLTFLINLTP